MNKYINPNFIFELLIEYNYNNNNKSNNLCGFHVIFLLNNFSLHVLANNGVVLCGDAGFVYQVHGTPTRQRIAPNFFFEISFFKEGILGFLFLK